MSRLMPPGIRRGQGRRGRFGGLELGSHYTKRVLFDAATDGAFRVYGIDWGKETVRSNTVTLLRTNILPGQGTSFPLRTISPDEGAGTSRLYLKLQPGSTGVQVSDSGGSNITLAVPVSSHEAEGVRLLIEWEYQGNALENRYTVWTADNGFDPVWENETSAVHVGGVRPYGTTDALIGHPTASAQHELLSIVGLADDRPIWRIDPDQDHRGLSDSFFIDGLAGGDITLSTDTRPLVVHA